MFEQYAEKARRIFLIARYEASQFGADCIGTEHLLLAFLRDNASTRFLSVNSVKLIHQSIHALCPAHKKISTSVDLPLSDESKRVLAYSAEEAEKLKQVYIGPEHLLLGLLREEGSLAANLLQERGLTIEGIRADLASGGADSPVRPGKALQAKLLKYLESHYHELGVSAAGPQIYVKPDRLAATPAFLFIQILSPIDCFTDVCHRMDELLAVGLRYVWLFDPHTGHAYTVLPGAGLHEFKGDILRTETPVLELPLAEVF